MSARILIVDDVPANARLLDSKLTAEYYQVAIARDGFEAVRMAREWQPDLILLDIMMPGMDGYQCCAQLKDDPATLHIPVVMVTALGEPEERLRGLEAGADDFLTKPVDLDTLAARTRSLIRMKRLLDEIGARGQTARALGVTTDKVAIPAIAGARALIVDDDDHRAAATQTALSLDSVMSNHARNGVDAMGMTASRAYDLIVVSLSLKREDPLKLVSVLRASDMTHDTPLLLIADPNEKARIFRGFDLGASDWLTLPLDANELRARARNQIRRKFYQDRLRSDIGAALELALLDPLTGLYNQRYLTRHLSGLLHGPRPNPLALLMVDVDHFKSVNDRFGHAAGDQALKLIADTLRSGTRVFDSVARYGGEEFVVVMPSADAVDAVAAGERLRAAVQAARLIVPSGEQVDLTVSIGVACTSADAGDPSALLRAADAALYEAKRGGRNRVRIAGPVLAN
jgi:two-component system cell cycle response regulator